MSRARRLVDRVRARVRWFLRLPNLEARVIALSHQARDLERVVDEDFPRDSAEKQAAINRDFELAVDAQRLAGDALAGIRAHDDRFDDVEQRLRRLERRVAISLVTDWVEAAEQPDDLLISVILPTRDRREDLEKAVDSVVAQRYPNWELVIVDDGSGDGTGAAIEVLSDERIRSVRTEGVGVCAARNVGLEQAKGEVITYLDDDNRLEPLWLKAVAWAFTQRPDVSVLYGARIIDDVGRVHGSPTAGEPMLQFEPFDRDLLETANFTDIGVIAHRAGLAEAWFDEQLVQMGDWDLLLRLTETEAPLELPVVAVHYFTDSTGRLSRGPTYDADRARVLQKVRERAS